MGDDDAAALERLAAAVPANVRDVCGKLAAAGYEAVTVGGAVRDALLGREPGDWDVATSARPEQVIPLFRHTIPTGLQHGTVTVVTSRGEHVEVTTYRGEGAYTDARRPDSVIFGVPLVEDLARRDLVVNAMAYDPGAGTLIDPFGGREDIAAKRLRAVGDPVARFTEDGLRVMRAVRFAARLEFTLEPATEAAIAPALPSLAKVSRERVAVELRALLAAREPSRGLAIAWRTGIVASVLPEVAAAVDAGSVAAWLARIDHAPEHARLAAMMVPLAPDGARAEAILRALKFSNAEAMLAARVVGVARAALEDAWTPPAVRRLLARTARDARAAAIELWAAEPGPGAGRAALVGEARRVLAAGEPLEVGALAVTGADVMRALDLKPGPSIGRILSLLLDRVLDEPALNTRDELLRIAQQLELELGRD